jgi:hypothetical protein
VYRLVVGESQCEGVWWDAADGTVRAEMVVFVSPVVDEEAGFVDGIEPVLVKAVIAEGAVEGFNEGILHGFAGLDVMKMNASSLCPKEDGLAGELRAIVGGDDFWKAASEGEFFQDINDSNAADGSIDMESQALAGEVIHQGQATKATASGKLVMNEVHGPAFIWALKAAAEAHGQWPAASCGVCGAGKALPHGRCVRFACD